MCIVSNAYPDMNSMEIYAFEQPPEHDVLHLFFTRLPIFRCAEQR